MKENDDKILKLKSEIAKKKEVLKGCKKFVPITNCSLPMDNKYINIHTLNSKDEIIAHMILVNSAKLSLVDLGLLEEYKLGGYKLNDWLEDLKNKLLVVDRKTEEAKLQVMEAKLTKLLSAEKQTELEIAEIENLLK